MSQRIKNLKAEADAIEAELLLTANKDTEKESNTADLIRDVADVKARLRNASITSKVEAARGKLVGAMLRGGEKSGKPRDSSSDLATKVDDQDVDYAYDGPEEGFDMLKFTADIDRRLSTLEKIIGSSSMALDEARISI